MADHAPKEDEQDEPAAADLQKPPHDPKEEHTPRLIILVTTPSPTLEALDAQMALSQESSTLIRLLAFLRLRMRTSFFPFPLPLLLPFFSSRTTITTSSSPSPIIDWDTDTDTDKTTPYLARIGRYHPLSRRMAVCALPKSAWDDPDLVLLRKFAAARFWDYREGPPPPRVLWGGGGGGDDDDDDEEKDKDKDKDESRVEAYCRCEAWPEAEIRAIQALEVLGEVSLSDGEVNEVFDTLRQLWVPGPAWWDSRDFALHLACILTTSPSTPPPTSTSLPLLRSLLAGLVHRFEDVSRGHLALVARIFVNAMPYAIAGAVLVSLLAHVFPSLAALPPVPVGLALWVGGLLRCALEMCAVWEDAGDMRRWEASLPRLAEAFPVLGELREGLV